MKNTDPMQPDAFYHVYNRGINSENIFKEERNYSYFLNKYSHFTETIGETYSYCLLKNHFHLLIQTYPEEEIRNRLQKKKNITVEEDFTSKSYLKPEEKPISWIISNAFGNPFKSYAQSINIAYNRTGRLFEQPFRRILVDNDAYFRELIYYIHHNPQNHGFVKDFRDYRHSSYHSFFREDFAPSEVFPDTGSGGFPIIPTKLKRDEVLNWFGDRNEFEKFHLERKILRNLDKFIIEYE